MFGPIATAILLAADPGVRLVVDGCARVAPAAVERQVALELRGRPLAETAVAIRCSRGDARITAGAEGREAHAVVALAGLPDVAVARTLALAAVELVFAVQDAAPPAVVSKPAPPPPPPPAKAPRLWLRAGGGLEQDDALVAAGRLGLSVSVGRGLGLALEGSFGSGTRSYRQGDVHTRALDVFLGLAVTPRLGAVLVPVAAGVRAGRASFSARPAAGVDADGVTGLRWGPAASFGVHLPVAGAITVGLDAQGGWHARGVRGLVDGAPGPALTGAWLAGHAAAGVRW